MKLRLKKEHEQGLIKFQAVNYEIEKNWSYFDKYLLSNKHIILARVESGKETSWKELDKIWEMGRDKTEYQAYIENEIHDFLKPKSVDSAKRN